MSRTSTRLFIAAAVLGLVAFAGAAYLRKVQRDFSGPTTITMGTVLKHGTRGSSARRRGSELFCWVSYEFTAPDGVKRQNWRFWTPGCGVSRGRPIPIQHSIANPDVNRPGGSEPWFPAGLLFFASGVAIVVAVLIRRAEASQEAASWRMDL